MPNRTASCHCGQLTVTCEGEPNSNVLCHCHHCQRRTGSAFSLGAWFPQHCISIKGDYKVYSRTGDRDREVIFNFCPNCGSNIFWSMPTIPGAIGVATGCMAGESLPAPTVIVFDESRQDWVENPTDILCLATV